MRAKNPLVSIKELAERSGIPYHVLFYSISCGRLPGPTHTIAGRRRRFYTEEDVEAFMPALRREARERAKRFAEKGT
jgi:MerR-like DNA binding protein